MLLEIVICLFFNYVAVFCNRFIFTLLVSVSFRYENPFPVLQKTTRRITNVSRISILVPVFYKPL